MFVILVIMRRHLYAVYTYRKICVSPTSSGRVLRYNVSNTLQNVIYDCNAIFSLNYILYYYISYNNIVIYYCQTPAGVPLPSNDF